MIRVVLKAECLDLAGRLALCLALALISTGGQAQAAQTSSDTKAAEEKLAAEVEEKLAEEGVQEEPAGPPERSQRHKALFGTEGNLPLEWVNSMRWRSIGPANMGGRMIDIAVHPEDNSTFWIASAGGGLLKTNNMGVSYEHLFQDETVSSIGAIAVSPADPDVLWVGTGEPNPRNSVSWGDGVYRSEDGGEHFAHVGLSESFQIGAIVAHPTDRDIAYVAALGRLWGPNEERGLYKTVDGGETWERVLFVDENTGVIDVIMKPDDADTLIAATYQRSRDGFDTNDPAVKWGEGAGMWKTTDAGRTWQRLEQGLPGGKWGRVGLDWYQADARVVYAVVETERITQIPENAAFLGLTGSDGEQVGIRVKRVEEEGPAAEAGLLEDDLIVTYDDKLLTTWKDFVRDLRMRVEGETASFAIMRGKESMEIEVTFGRYPSEDEDQEDMGSRRRSGPFSSGLGGQVENVQDLQGVKGHEFGGVYRSDDGGDTWERINSVNPRPMYYSQVRVDPSDEQNVYVLGTSLYRSSDSGKTFSSDGAKGAVHVDHHALWIDPKDGRHIMLGNDGGLYVTWDRMETWDHHNHVAMGQFYDVETDQRADYRVFGGLQDNGSWGAPVNVGGRGPSNEDWFRIGYGDGFVCRVDPENVDLVYFESQNGGMGRRNLESGAVSSFRPRGSKKVKIRFNWKTPYILSHHNSGIFYSAGNYVFRSLKRGSDMKRISPEISHTDRGAATALAESPRNSDALYVGTDDGGLWRTLDGGVNWEDLFQLNGAPTDEVLPEDVDLGDISSREVFDEALPYALTEGASFDADDDPVGGLWVAVNESGEALTPAVRLELRLDSDGSVTGTVVSVLGEGPVRTGSYSRETSTLTLRGVVGGVGYTLTGTIEGSRLAARLTGGGGLVDVSFDAVRTEDATGEVQELVAEVDRSQSEAPAGSIEEVPAEEESIAEESIAEAADDGKEADEEQQEPAKFIEETIDQLLPGRFHVSSLVASAHRKDRVFVTFDGHRSDVDLPFVYVSDDNGSTWESLVGNLPPAAGSARVIVEDPVQEDLLFLGTEFGAFVSVDRGESWTRLNSNLPTVPVHDFSINEASGEIVAGTHGRSLWVLDISALREIDSRVLSGGNHLFKPSPIFERERLPERGTTMRHFVGEGRASGLTVTYALSRKAREVKLYVEDTAGEVVAELETELTKGLHRVQWNLRRTGSGGRRRARRLDTGTYWIVLEVGKDIQRVEVKLP